MSDVSPGPIDPRTAMWLAVGTAVVLVVLAVVFHNALSIVFLVFAAGDVAYAFWLRRRAETEQDRSEPGGITPR